MPNTNDCSNCFYKQITSDGWCYMFKEEPQELCSQHTYIGVGTADHVDFGTDTRSLNEHLIAIRRVVFEMPKLGAVKQISYYPRKKRGKGKYHR